MSAPTAVPLARRRLGVLLVALLAAVAAAQWHVVFGWRETAPLVIVALAAAGLAPAVGSPRRPLAATGSASVAGLVVALVVAGRDDPAPALLLDGLLHGWSRILSTTLEVPVTEGRFLLPVAVVWLAAFAGAETALRLTTRPVLAVLPPLVAFGVALPFGAGGGSSLLAVVLLVTGLAAVHVLSQPTVPDAVAAEAPPVDGWRARVRPPLRAAGTAGFVGVAAVAGLAVGVQVPLLDPGRPYDPRADQRPPLDDVATIDPLSLLAGWALDPDDPVLFTADGPATDRWRLAVLDRYEPGAGWSSRAGYVALGTRVPLPEVPDTTPVAGAGPKAERTVTIGALDGVWLPTTGRPVAVANVAAHVDRATGMLVHGGGLAAGLRYRLTSEPAQVTVDCTPADDQLAPPPSGDDAWIGADLMAYATAITQGATSMCAQAELIEAYLRSDRFTFDPDAPSGATLARTVGLLEPGDDPKAGTSEQFATAFALLARASGMESRVAVGFRPGDAMGGAQRVHASDAYAWAEVRFDRLGWVSFDPTPGSGDDEDRPESSSPPVTAPPSTTATTATTTPTSTTVATSTTIGEGSGSCDSRRRCDEGSGLGVALLAAVGGLVLVIGTAVLIELVRRRRRSARRGGTAAADRVVGAWRQCLVDLRDGGLPLTVANTASDYVADTRQTLGPRLGEELDSVANLANQALFSGTATEEDAAQAWRSTDRLTATLAAERSQGARLRRALDVRALVRS